MVEPLEAVKGSWAGGHLEGLLLLALESHLGAGHGHAPGYTCTWGGPQRRPSESSSLCAV